MHPVTVHLLFVFGLGASGDIPEHEHNWAERVKIWVKWPCSEVASFESQRAEGRLFFRRMTAV